MAQFQNATRVTAVTPSDAVAIAGGPAEVLWIGVGGTISFVPYDPALAAPATQTTTVGVGLFPVKVLRVNATGTTAAQILALS